jgi:DNA-binding CsgD family transcriptional regulator
MEKTTDEIMAMPWADMSEAEREIARLNGYWKHRDKPALTPRERELAIYQRQVERVFRKPR